MTLDPKRDTRIQSAVGLAVEAGVGGVTISPAAEIGAVWAKIGDPDPYEDDRYEWREVYSDEKGEFHEYEQAGVAQGGGRGSIRHNNRLYEPAVEVNGKATEAGTIVRLIPSDLMVDPNAETTASHRTWMFANPLTGLRPFVLTADLIPTGGGEPDLTIAARWLDVLGVETVALFPPHQSGFDTSTFFSLGIGRPDGAYHRGTYGWAQWQAKARAEITADGLTWHGEWQVVTMYADLIMAARVYDAAIAPNETKVVDLYWINKDAGAYQQIDSGYNVSLTNDTPDTLEIGAVLKIHYSRNDNRWYPIGGSGGWPHYAKVQTGWVNTKAGSAASEVVSVKTCKYDGTGVVGAAFNVNTVPRPNLDTALFAGYVVEWHTTADGDKVICSDIWDDPIGTVKWESVNTANIRDGWRLCDGTAGAPDLSGMFIMSLDPGGQADEDGIADTGGFRKHGVTENNHADHSEASIAAALANHSETQVVTAIADHVHDNNHSLSSGAIIEAAFPNNNIAPHSDHDHFEAGGAGLTHGAAGGAGALVHTDSDNRPRYYVMAAIQRFE